MKTPPKNRSAFSLVELLVAISLLVMIIVIVSQLMARATATISGSRKRLSADAQARMIFDRIGEDLARMLKRSDAGYLFDKMIGNDAFFFYSEAPGVFDGSSMERNPISLVGYRITQNHPRYPGQPVFERLSKGLSWEGEGVAPVFLTYQSPSAAAPEAGSTLQGQWPTVVNSTSTDPDFVLLSDQVYRFEIAFLMKDGRISNNPSSGSTVVSNGLKEVAAIIVGIGILDGESVKMASDFSGLIGALPESIEGVSIEQTWSTSSYLTSSGLPAAAASQLRFYQRYFYLW